MEPIINLVNGTFRIYAEVRSPKGYCFYDIDATERNYITYIATPIIDKTEIERKFILIEGDADKLNELKEKENSLYE